MTTHTHTHTEQELLRPAHVLYTTTISSFGMALSLETAALAWLLCEVRQPRSIVDLGSGFSSYVLRRWAQEQPTPVTVWSVDDDAGWLEASRKFCEQQGVDTTNFATWDSFRGTSMQHDLVLYDLGRMQVRDENVGRALDMVTPTGIVIVDDMHKWNYSNTVRREIFARGMVGTDMKASTTDAHEGRHCWLAQHPDQS